MAARVSIGATLRDARARRKLDLATAEAATKIRVRYLRALENEEWDVLPGGSYTRSFIRTYGDFLGLDGDRLADDFRRTVGDGPPAAPRVEAPAVGTRRAARRREGRPGLSRGAAAALVSVALIAALVVIALLSGGGPEGGGRTAGPPPAPPRQHGGRGGERKPKVVTLVLVARAPVWVCLLNARNEAVVGGTILPAGAHAGPFRSGRFTLGLGNGSVRLTVNGDQASIQETPNPVGYEIRRDGRVRPLAPAERPTCA
ncbi:MAG: helix-turn-helix domain-containing protein [Solirubrobacterales bacterium]